MSLNLLLSSVLVLSPAAPSSPKESKPAVVAFAPTRYTETARRARWEGIARIRVSINGQGRVTTTEHLGKRLPIGLSDAAEAAARSWRFETSRRRSRAVVIEYAFSLFPFDAPDRALFDYEAPYRVRVWARSPDLRPPIR